MLKTNGNVPLTGASFASSNLPCSVSEAGTAPKAVALAATMQASTAELMFLQSMRAPPYVLSYCFVVTAPETRR